MAPGVRGKPLAWGVDRVQDKSSLDVLLDWLAVEGNYRRWTGAGQLAKEALSYEVVSLLQGQGIRHRTFRGVWRKIDDLARNVDMANRLLARNGLEGAVSLEGCGPLLRAEMQRRWPYYELLAPVMSATATAAVQPTDNQGEASNHGKGPQHQENQSQHQEDQPQHQEEQPQHQEDQSQHQAEQSQHQEDQPQHQEEDQSRRQEEQPPHQEEQSQYQDKDPQHHKEQDQNHGEKPPSNQEQPEREDTPEQQPEPRDVEKPSEEDSHEDSHESNAIFMLANLVNQKNTGEEMSNGQDADAQPSREGRPTRSPAKRKESHDEEYVPEAGKGLPRWGSDHVNGRSSLDLLIVWLTTADNYARWKLARPKSPMSKEALCSEISSMMKEHGIHHRKNIDIRKKVWSVEESFAVANQLLIARNIESLSECDTILSAKVLRHCPQYEQLAPFMSAKHGGIGRREKRQYRSRKRKQQEMEDQAIHQVLKAPVEQQVEDVGAVHEVPAENMSESSDPAISDPVEQEGLEISTQVPMPELLEVTASIEVNPSRQLKDVRASFELGHERNVIERETMREKSKLELEALRIQSECELETERKKQKLQLETIRLKSELELEKAKFALQVTRERNEYALVVERALSRQKLMSAGLSQSEVDRILPSKVAVSENMF